MRSTAGVVRSVIASALLAATAGVALGQTTRPFTENADTHYFDFWPGTWYPVVDGRVDTTGSAFVVRRSVNSAAFEEQWIQRADSVVTHSVAIRSWDQIANKWMFVWVSPNALFQVWEGQKVGPDWYIVKEFNFEGQRFHSRQAWIPDGPNRLVRVMERSTDGGRTWQPRLRTTFQRVRPAP